MIINGVNRHEWHPKRTRHHYRRYGKDLAIIKCKDQRRTDISLPQPDHLVLFMRPSRNPCDGGNEPRIPWLMAKWAHLSLLTTYQVQYLSGRRLFLIEQNEFRNIKTIQVFFWSLGNESYAEENIRQMNDYFKSRPRSTCPL